MPRSPAINGANVESPDEYDSMPSTSCGVRPASRMALRTAMLPSARVVLPEPRRYSVSPTPTMAYLSRRWPGVVVTTSPCSVTAILPRWLPHHRGARRASQERYCTALLHMAALEQVAGD